MATERIGATMKPEITSSSDKEKEYVVEQLMKFNSQHFGLPKEDYIIPLNFHISNEEGDIVAGIAAVMLAKSSVYVDILWVDVSYRQHGYGAQILRHVEDEAKKQGAVMVHLDTFDFQAQGFYLKQGYELVSALEGSPAVGNTRFYLRKML